MSEDIERCPRCGRKLGPEELLISIFDLDGKFVDVFHCPRTSFDAFLDACQRQQKDPGEVLSKLIEAAAKSVSDPEEAYDRLPWEPRLGDKGPFEWCQAKAAGDSGSSDLYNRLANLLTQNNEKYTEPQWRHYYWSGMQGPYEAVFRRLKKRFQNEKGVSEQFG